MDIKINNSHAVSGEFIDHQGERFYQIRNVDKMAPFFISLVSASDHWLFISSNGGLTAGRVSPETPLFPYVTVDKIYESTSHTGSKTQLRIYGDGSNYEWEPFNQEHDGRYKINRHLYKNDLGNKLCFEEINHDLQLTFRYCWMSSDEYGFVRHCEIHNLAQNPVHIDMVDGLQNILPAGTPRFIQTNSSNLVDAYKRTELDEQTGLAMFTLYSGITDRPEPCESLKANTVFCQGLSDHNILLSSGQLEQFRLGEPIVAEAAKRGIRGAYLAQLSYELEPYAVKEWQFIANVEQSQAQVVRLRQYLLDPEVVAVDIARSIDSGSDGLARIMASSDGFQAAAEENMNLHHYANVLFNILRGGIFYDHYRVNTQDFISTIEHFNHAVFYKHRQLWSALPQQLEFTELLSRIKEQGDPRLESLCYEYLPVTFARRHGDPSRPWNQFAIKLKDKAGNPLLSYQGNWRDIFQNWEALALSYPQFIENIIAKFVNASTIDGYNPYRITKEGIDWEIEDPEDPWSYIGYWGDHQIIYLLKFLEHSSKFHPQLLGELLRLEIFCYANVPYRIHSFESLVKDPKNTVTFDQDLADVIEQRVTEMGVDGKLLLDGEGLVYQVNLLEKLIVPLLSKLANLVIDGGIWLNTQRPEWNDANNALVGQGLSMVTLFYLRRYVCFIQDLLASEKDDVILSKEVALWLDETTDALENAHPDLGSKPLTSTERFDTLSRLGQAASRYRENVYSNKTFTGKVIRRIDNISKLLDEALVVIEHSISFNQRSDGLYHAYNLADFQQTAVDVENLYPMLEGQVAALSSGAISPEQSVTVIEALFSSKLYREDQHSFMLYPDRKLQGFLDKNLISDTKVATIPLLQHMIVEGNNSIVFRDAEGNYRFNAEIINRGELESRLDNLNSDYGQEINNVRETILSLYEDVFNHQEFTGRSGGMFGFEGLGCIYWHMVSKLLLAVQEVYFAAIDHSVNKNTSHRLGELYYQVRKGIGFNKTPEEYGAFPTDPYSHTPKHAGASQPGMTGQVKEELLTRFGELGIRVSEGVVHFQPALLRLREFNTETRQFRYLNVLGKWKELSVPESALAFTWCQVPVIYELQKSEAEHMIINCDDGSVQKLDGLILPAEYSQDMFKRNVRIVQITVLLNKAELFDS